MFKCVFVVEEDIVELVGRAIIFLAEAKHVKEHAGDVDASGGYGVVRADLVLL